jgi:hypothetical protein
VPRKKRQPRARKITINKKRDWNKILKEIDTKEVPLELLNSINITLVDGTNVDIDVPSMLMSSDSLEVETYLNGKFEELDDYILNVDFFINVDTVSEEVQLSTGKLLKGL